MYVEESLTEFVGQRQPDFALGYRYTESKAT